LTAFRAEHGFGRAIAAPQIGHLWRVLFVRMSSDGFEGALVNPRIVDESSERIVLWDDCLCFPDLLVKVSRAEKIAVEYLDESGESKTLEADGDLSELLQHEIDHLDGILAVHRVVEPGAIILRSEWLRQGKPRA
jgi:peptide deformylase